MSIRTLLGLLVLGITAGQMTGCGGGGSISNVGSAATPTTLSVSKSASAKLVNAPTNASNFAQAVTLVQKYSSAKSGDVACDSGAVLPSYSSTTDTMTQDGRSFTAASLDDNFLTLNAVNNGTGTISTQYYDKSMALLSISDVSSGSGNAKCRFGALAQPQKLDLKPQIALLFGDKYVLNCPTMSATILADGLVTFSGPATTLDSMQIAVRRVAASWLGEGFNTKAYLRLSTSSLSTPSIVFALSETGDILGVFENTNGLGVSGKLSTACSYVKG
jgi:hypothetical protein